jgi:hypothetical protein
MKTTPNIGLKIGAFAGDGGQEKTYDDNMKKIDAAVGALGGGTVASPLTDAAFNATTHLITFTRADDTTFTVDLSSLAGPTT